MKQEWQERTCRQEWQNHDFTSVTAALEEYQRRTGKRPLALGGWEVEDARIHPPAQLLRRLAGIRPRLLSYAYPHDFAIAKARAAETLGWNVSVGGEPLRAAQVAVLQNSTQGLLLALAALRARGVSRAIVAAPTYYAAVDACHHLSLETTIVPARDFLTGALDVKRITVALRSSAEGTQAALLLTNPAYSLGVEYGWDQLRALLAALPESTPVLLDETRLGLSWTSEAPWYAADFPPNVLVLRSPSKIFLVNGLKTSFLYGPAPMIRDVERLHEALLGSVPGHTEAVALAYLEAWRAWISELAPDHAANPASRTAKQTPRVVPSGAEPDSDGPLRRWRRALVSRLAHNLAAARPHLEAYGYTLSPVNSGPYALAAAARAGASDLDCERAARDLGVLLMDGRYFFHEHPDWASFRLNLCGDPSQTCAALARLFSGATRAFRLY